MFETLGLLCRSCETGQYKQFGWWGKGVETYSESLMIPCLPHCELADALFFFCGRDQWRVSTEFNEVE